MLATRILRPVPPSCDRAPCASCATGNASSCSLPIVIVLLAVLAVQPAARGSGEQSVQLRPLCGAIMRRAHMDGGCLVFTAVSTVELPATQSHNRMSVLTAAAVPRQSDAAAAAESTASGAASAQHRRHSLFQPAMEHFNFHKLPCCERTRTAWTPTTKLEGNTASMAAVQRLSVGRSSAAGVGRNNSLRFVFIPFRQAPYWEFDPTRETDETH